MQFIPLLFLYLLFTASPEAVILQILWCYQLHLQKVWCIYICHFHSQFNFFSLSILIWAIIFIWEQRTKKRRNKNLGAHMIWGSSSWCFWLLRLLVGSPAYWLRCCSWNEQDGDLAITLSCSWNINNNSGEHGLSLSPFPGCNGEVKVAVLAWQVSLCSHTAILSGARGHRCNNESAYYFFRFLLQV